MPVVVNVILSPGGEVMYFGCVCIRGELGFLNCDDICMCVVNKQFVFASVHVDLQYDETSLTFTAVSVSLCCVCSRLWSACKVVVVPYVDAVVSVTIMHVLFVLHVCMLRECEVEGNAGVGDGGVVVVSAGHVGSTRGSGIVFSAAETLGMSVVPGMREVGGVCEMCICLARSGVGGEE